MLLPAVRVAFLVAQLSAPSLDGTVRDDETGEPVAGAVVALPDAGRLALTDSAGAYDLRGFDGGPHDVRITRLGYRSRTLRLFVPPRGALRLDVNLQPWPVRLSGVTVRDSGSSSAGEVDALPRQSHDIGSRTLTLDDLRAHPLVAEPDAFAAFGAAPDVAADPELPTSLSVRGGSSDQNLVLLDGVPVYSPYHYGGTFGALNPDALSRVDLHAGAPSAAVGGALSSVVTAWVRPPDRERVRTRGAVSTTAARLTVDGPLTGGRGILLSASRGYPASLEGSGDDEYLRGMTSDVLGKLTDEIAGGTLELLAYRSANRLGFADAIRDERAEDERADDERVDGETPPRGARPLRQAGASAQGAQNRYRWLSESYALGWRRSLGEQNHVAAQLWRAGFGAEIHWSGDDGPLYVTGARGASGAQVVLSASRPAADARFGVGLERQHVEYAVRGPAAPAGDPAVPGFRIGSTPTTVAAFVENRLLLGERWRLTAGLRGSSVLGRTPLFEPRVSTRYALARAVALSAGYARSYQGVQSLRNGESLMARVIAADLPVAAGAGGVPTAQSDQLSAALEARTPVGVRLAVDGYARRDRGLVLVAPVTAQPFAVDGFATGRGEAWGLGFVVERRDERLYAHAAYGIGAVTRVAARQVYHPAFERTRTLSAALAYHPSGRTTLRAALRAASGRPTTLIEGPFEWEECNVLDGGCEIAGSPQRTRGALNGERLPPYVGLDLGVRREWHPRVSGHAVTLGGFAAVSNVLGRHNVWAYTLDPATRSRDGVPMRPFSLLTLGVDWRD